MHKKILILALLMAATLTACRSLPPVAPVSKESAAIGVDFDQVFPVQLFGETVKVQTVFFVRLNGENMFSENNVIRSTWHRKGRVYLLNAEPGEYVAVATSYVRRNTAPTGGGGQIGNVRVSVSGPSAYGYTTFLSQKAIEATRVRVEPGKLAVMGRFKLKMNRTLTEADDAQKHYINILAPGALTKSTLGKMFSSRQNYVGRLLNSDVTDNARANFKNGARGDFKETPWIYLAD